MVKRRHRHDHPQAAPEDDPAHRARARALRRDALPRRRLGKPRLRAQPAPPTARRRSWSRATTSGCGSSREHAPWALLDFGIRCVIAPSFADIFHNNCFKNGILPIALRRPSRWTRSWRDAERGIERSHERGPGGANRDLVRWAKLPLRDRPRTRSAACSKGSTTSPSRSSARARPSTPSRPEPPSRAPGSEGLHAACSPRRHKPSRSRRGPCLTPS